MSILSQTAFVKLSERLSTSTHWDQVKSYCLQDQQYDALRQEILARLGSLVQDLPAVGENFRAKCEAIVRVQECLYDLQLVEHVSKVPTLGVAKLVMAMDKRRAVKRVQTCEWDGFGKYSETINYSVFGFSQATKEIGLRSRQTNSPAPHQHAVLCLSATVQDLRQCQQPHYLWSAPSVRPYCFPLAYIQRQWGS